MYLRRRSINVSVFNYRLDRNHSEEMAGLRRLAAAWINAYNDFGKPEKVKLHRFLNFNAQKNMVTIELPANAVVMIELAVK